MAKSNLDSGFLILYDWLPAFRSLSGDELKELLFALIDNQKDGTPLPTFDDPHTAIFAQMIAPTIKRRLDGLASATKTSKPVAAKASSKPKAKTAEPAKISDTYTSDKESQKSLEIQKKAGVEGTVEGSLHPRKEEIRKAERSRAEISGAEVSGAYIPPRISDANLSSVEFARKLMESLEKDPPKKIYKE